MVNVGNGNVLVQADDVDIHERGIDLAFQRSYNSQSQHDSANSDQSIASNFGNGWTNTFDAHIAFYNNKSILSVYDIDGTRYDYTSSGGGAWLSPPGMQGTTLTLATQSMYNNGCYYQWTKKTGTAYIFYAPDYSSQACAASGAGVGLNGRIVEIAGRNSNNYIMFTYAWQGGVVDSSHLGSIIASHADGQQLTLSFTLTDGSTPCNGSGPCELRSLTRPDGQAITYSYDGSGDLTQINFPGNNVAPTLWENFNYAGSYLMSGISSPRYAYSYAQTGGNPTDGTTTNFTYYANTRQLQYMQRAGFVNFVPNDGTGLLLQSGVASGFQAYYQQNFSGYAPANCATLPATAPAIGMAVSSYGAATTTSVTDSDGHSTIYSTDGCWRLTQTQDNTGSLWLLRNEGWDSENDLVAETDDRGNETDYAYDANGNVTKMALPLVTNVQFRPTSVYSYDTHNNVTAYCDPVDSNNIGQTWTSAPGITADNLCLSQTGAQRFNWATSSVNWFGYLSDMYTPTYDGGGHGNHTHFTYDPSRQGGNDYSLPTTVTGDSFVEQNGSTIAPTQNFSYDGYGNLTCYSKLVEDGGTIAWWRVNYDNLNRQTDVADPDDASFANTVVCPNSAAPGMSSSHLVATKTYYADGATASTQTPAEYAGNASTTFAYDADGNQTSETRHYNNTVGTTTKWYDGEGRLVEVRLPHDSTDFYSYNWLTRYLYDLSNGHTVTIGTISGIYAYGNLYKTQEWLGSTGWADLKGNGYDAIDRSTAQYAWASGQHSSGLSVWTNTYDQNTQTYGLLAQKKDPLGEVTSYAYDAAGHTINVTYSGDGGVTPAENKAYDADGRVVSTTSSSMGTLSSTYDADGKVLTVVEPSGGGLTSSATYTYSYYPNGLRSALSVSSSALTQNNLLQYTYRADGARTSLLFAYGSTSASISWNLSPASRTQTMSDSSGQPARVFTYDSYGRIVQDQMPSATISGETYDAEGERTGYNYPGGNTTIGYNVRGELTTQTYSNASDPCQTPPPPATYANLKQQSANGTMLSEYYDCSQLKWISDASIFDPYTGANLGPANLGDDSVSINYDKANRQTSSTDSWQWTHPSGDTTETVYGNGTVARTYDAENHLLSEGTSGQWNMYDMPLGDCISDTQRNLSTAPQFDSAGGSYAWGPNGHPDIIDASTYHWDGDTPLFVTSSSGALLRTDIEGVAYFAPGSPVQFLDRDQTGSVVAAHAAGSAGTWYPATPYHEPCGAESLSDEPGPDGIDDGVNIVQGVRNYDPSLQQWSTPDAYHGEVGDPISQKAYMWNRNNPFVYQDPSGYYAFGGYWQLDLAEPQQQSLPPESEGGESGKNEVEKEITGQGYLEAQQSEIDNQLNVPKNAPKLPSNDSQLKHIFRSARGHVSDSATNRAELRLTAAKGTRVGQKLTPGGSVDIFHRANPGGGTWWVEVLNGIIQNGGLNP